MGLEGYRGECKEMDMGLVDIGLADMLSVNRSDIDCGWTDRGASTGDCGREPPGGKK